MFGDLLKFEEILGRIIEYDRSQSIPFSVIFLDDLFFGNIFLVFEYILYFLNVLEQMHQIFATL